MKKFITTMLLLNSISVFAASIDYKAIRGTWVGETYQGISCSFKIETTNTWVYKDVTKVIFYYDGEKVDSASVADASLTIPNGADPADYYSPGAISVYRTSNSSRLMYIKLGKDLLPMTGDYQHLDYDKCENLKRK